MTEQLKKLKAEMEAAANQNFEKKDWNEITFKPSMGDSRVRIIANKNEDELFFLADGYHVMSNNYYADCGKNQGEKCPICDSLKELWDDNDLTRQATYRQIKRKARFTYQVIVLDDEGNVADQVPKLYSCPKTLHDIILKSAFDEIDICSTDLIIRKEQGKPYVSYENSYFLDEKDCKDIEFTGEVNALDMGRNYHNDKTTAPLSKIIRSYNLTPLNIPEAAKQVKDSADDDLNSFEQELLKSINE